MPPREKVAKAKPDRPERGARRAPVGPKPQNSPVLIIFLVFFILVSLVLGVFLYLAQDKIDAATKNADAKAQEASNALKNQLLEQEYFLPAFRLWCGDPTINEADIDRLRQKNNEFAAQSIDPRNDEAHKFFLPLQGMIVGSGTSGGLIGPLDNTGKPKTNLRQRIEELLKERDLTVKNYKGKEDELQKLAKDYDEYKKQFNEQVVKEARAAVQRDYEAQLRDKLAKKDEAIKDLNDKIAAVTRDVEKLIAANKQNFDEDKKRLEDKVRAAVDDLGNQKNELKKLASNRGVINFDKERGHVTKVDASGESVTIDIGSSSNLQSGTTFSVYRRGPSGKPEADPVATLEVISVLGPNQAQARVTKVAKPIANRPSTDPQTKEPLDPSSSAFWITDPRQFHHAQSPILAGDLLFNPLWDPAERPHVYLAGVFDLDGDSNDDIEAFKRMLTQRGTIIDGYLDPTADYAIRGKLDYQTDYLIIGGGFPIITAGGANADAAKAGGGRVGENVVNLQVEAQKKGVQIVKLKDFLARMGFDTLRVPSNPNAGGIIQGKRAAPEAGAGEKPAEKPADKAAEKKEEK